MELGDSTAAEPDRRSVVNGILDKLNDDLAELVTAVESGGFDHLQADQQVALWQRFERLSNKLPLVDHRLIAHAQASDPGVLLGDHGAVSGAGAATLPRRSRGPDPGCGGARTRTSMLGEQLEPLLPGLRCCSATVSSQR